MKQKLRFQTLLVILVPSILLFVLASMMVAPKGFVPTTLNDFFLPGSQPLQSGTIDSPGFCDNCHGGYDLNVEPSFNWRGSMMAQAQRDPLYLACLAIANQDAPDVGDLCIRCHTPKGWLEGRSVPTDGSALIAADRDGVQCHFCHKLIAPTPVGVNPYPNIPLYSTPPSGNIPSTYTIDQAYLPSLTHIPDNHSNGMYVADNADNRRGPYYNPQSNHNTPYSPFHSEAKICGTCHDVSNPVYQAVKDANGNYLGYTPNSFDQPSPSFSPYDMFPIERTYSEWLMSAYNSPGGISGTYFGGNKAFVSTCQDCHMKDVTGKGCNKNFAPVRNDLPLHDMTGGNTFIPDLLKILFPGEVNNAALDAGKARALDMLQHAASVHLTVNQMQKEVIVKVTNETAHKLPSGYPEGRRIWINLKASNSLTAQSFESGYYDAATGYLNKTGVKVYEIKPGLSPGLASATGLTPGESFHFVLNDTIYFDNRIPPRGFTNANFHAIQSPPVGYTYADGQYWDETVYNLPFYPDAVEVTLYYQTTTKEYVEFLRDENVTNNAGQVLYNLWNTNGKSAPVAMNYNSWTGPPVGPEAPVADFIADNTTPAVGQTVTFTDLSSNAPTAWNWSFNPSSVTYIGGTTSSSQHPLVQFNDPGNYSVGLTASNSAGSDTETKTDYITVQSPLFGLELKAFLEGPFAGLLMNTLLNESNSIPFVQPFNVAPWFYNGGESVIGIPDPEIVDWVLIELRETSGDASTATSLKKIGRIAAFIKSDGLIVAKDGNNLPEFELMVADNLYVVLWHRNHLGIMSALPLLRSGENYIYDFSSSGLQAYGGANAQKQLLVNIWGMIAADGNADGNIDDSDKNYPWMIEAGLSGYYFGDYNLDNQVNNLDKNQYWLPNTGKTSYIPD